MTVRGMRLMTGSMRLVGKNTDSTTYRARFRHSGSHPVLGSSFPVLLTFDNSERLIAFRRDTAEEVRREVERQRRQCDSHYLDHMYEQQRREEAHRKMKDCRNAMLAQQNEMRRLMKERTGKSLPEVSD